MNMLAEGLSRNPGFQQLSFTYCNITPEGGEGIKKILIYSKSTLLELLLSGNPLGNDGIIQVFQGVGAAKTLATLYVSDNQYDDSKPVMDSLKFAMTKCKTCTNYDLRHNSLSDEGIEKLVEILGVAEHVSKLGVSEWLSSEAVAQL